MKKVEHKYPGLEIYRDIVRERRDGVPMLVQATRALDGLFSVSAGTRMIGLAKTLKEAERLSRSPKAFEGRLVGEVYPHYHYEVRLPEESAYERELRLTFHLHDLGLEVVSIYHDEDNKLVAMMKPVGM